MMLKTFELFDCLIIDRYVLTFHLFDARKEDNVPTRNLQCDTTRKSTVQNKTRRQKMDAQNQSETNEDFRVRVTSKKQVIGQMNQYKAILNEALDEQTEIPEDTKQRLLEQLLADFEAAVQASVLVNGQTWDDAPDGDDDDDDVDKLAELEDELDGAIVGMTQKRRTLPPQILRSAIHALKMERQLADLKGKAVKPQQKLKNTLTEILPHRPSGLTEHTTQAIKSIRTLQNQAEGLLELISMKTSQASLVVHQEVFGSNQSEETPPPSPNSAQCSVDRLLVRRDVQDAVASAGYVEK
ncbi:kinetochore-associated protein NSL1 homolog [Vanacampus margaritifer]